MIKVPHKYYNIVISNRDSTKLLIMCMRYNTEYKCIFYNGVIKLINDNTLYISPFLLQKRVKLPSIIE